MEKEQIMKILVIIGAILILIQGIVRIIAFFRDGFASAGIIAIIYFAFAAILILIVVKPGQPIPFTGIILLFLGIIAIIISLIWFPRLDTLSLIGGVLVLIAGILGLKAK